MKTISSGLGTPMGADAYYGVAQDNAATYTDWGKIGQNISDAAEAQKKIIDDHSKELDKNSNDLMNSIYVNPLTQDTGPNDVILKMSQAAQTLLLQNQKDFKSGKKSEHDYLLFQQNMKSDVDNGTALASKFSAASQAIKDGVAKGTHLGEGLYNAGLVQELSAYSNTLPAFGVDGHLAYYKTKKNPTTGLVEPTNEMYSPRNAQAMLQPLEKYDVNGAINQSYGLIGKVSLQLNEAAKVSKAGSLTKLFGPDILEEMKSNPKLAEYRDAIESTNKAIDSYTQSMVSDPRHLSSILQTELGYHKWTEDLATAKANPDMIYRKADPLGGPPIMVTDDSSPHYKEQLAEVTKLVRDRMIGHFNQGNEISPVSAVTAPPAGAPAPIPEKPVPQATDTQVKSFIKDSNISGLIDPASATKTRDNLLEKYGDLGIDVNVDESGKSLVLSKSGSDVGKKTFKIDDLSDVPVIEQTIKNMVNRNKLYDVIKDLQEKQKRSGNIR